ncbi:MAG: hypothetical protein KY445_05340, partial [Armatimonadetes bacterium]|nr:hypothetical protein [Armatimonadota bacterium]
CVARELARTIANLAITKSKTCRKSGHNKILFREVSPKRKKHRYPACSVGLRESLISTNAPAPRTPFESPAYTRGHF